MKIRKIILPIYKIWSAVTFKVSGTYSIKAITDWAANKLKTDFCEIQGHKMFIDSTDAHRLSIYGFLEPLETELFKKEIKEGEVVLDIGANIGYYTLIAARIVGKKGKVFAFEPHPENFALLKKNVEINGYDNVVLINKAVSNKNGKVRLYLSERDTGASSIYPEDSQKSIEVETIRLDDYFKDFKGKIDFVKMDIEGSEGEALQGMRGIIDKNKNIKIITEFWQKALNKSEVKAKEFFEMIYQRFELKDIDELDKKIKQIDHSNQFLERYRERNTNIFCVWTKNY